MPSPHRARYSRLQLSPPGSNFLRGPIRQPEVARYREVALASSAISFVLGFCYWVQPPVEDAHSIWEWSWRYPTGFSLNALLTTLYILAMQVRQIVFIVGLWLDPMEQIDTAIIMMPHVISFNILHTVWAMAFGHGHFIIATLVLVINFANCAAGYFRHYRHCPIHELRWGLVSGPWAFNMIAILWTGALIFPEGATRVLHLVDNLVIWVVLFVGMGFLVVFHDYNMGFSLSFLMVSMTLCQIFTKIVALQWLFATIISIVLFVCSCTIASPIFFDRAFIVTLGNKSTNEERTSLVNSVFLPSQTSPIPPFEPQRARTFVEAGRKRHNGMAIPGAENLPESSFESQQDVDDEDDTNGGENNHSNDVASLRSQSTSHIVPGENDRERSSAETTTSSIPTLIADGS